ncbi:hypothetical protein OROGR_010998 [Orobanche gracilis]
MAILSEFQEEEHKKPSPSASTARKTFNASLDPSIPLGFLEKVFEFVAKESDLFMSDSLVKDVNAVLRMVKDKVEVEDKKMREVKAEGSGNVEKKIRVKEEEAPAVNKEGVLKEEIMEEQESENKPETEAKGPRGNNF